MNTKRTKEYAILTKDMISFAATMLPLALLFVALNLLNRLSGGKI